MLKRFLITALCVMATPAAAFDVQIAPGATQANFESVSKDIIATLNYKALGPAENSGVSGFAVGAVGSYVPTVDPAAWANVTGQTVNELGLVGLSVAKGLPMNLDVGAFYSLLPSTSVKVYGGEVRFALLSGSPVSPAVALRGSYSRAAGIRGFDADALGFDLSASKGFTAITPYAGIGYVSGTSDPHNTIGLSKVEVNALRFFAGARLSLGLFDVVPEYERIGDNNIFNLKAGVSF